jgi:hypothetical protein
MCRSFDDRLKKITTACVVSAFTAGIISMLVSPSSADKAAIAISVNRTTKGDRLPLPPVAQPTQQDVISTKKAIPKRALPGCESAFSPFADPTHGRLLTHCTS